MWLRYVLDIDLDRLIHETPYKGFPVIQNGVTLGYVERHVLEHVVDTYPPDTWIVLNEPDGFTSSIPLDYSIPLMVHPHTHIKIMVELFAKMGLRYILITRNGVLQGILTKKDVIRLAVE
jgi:chloride channel 3/4/5